MDVDTASDNTSIDDKIDDFCENPTRDALTEGLMSLLKPTVDQLDERIRATRICQIELKQRIESLTEELLRINEALQCPLETDSYVKKLVNAKHKITIVSNILQNTQERLNKIHQAVERNTAKRKALLDHSSMYINPTSVPDKEEQPKSETEAMLPAEQEYIMDTPIIKLSDKDLDTVYEPAEDSFLLIDALEADLETLKATKPTMCLEIGSGSGIVITSIAMALSKHCQSYHLAIDINIHACNATRRTAALNSAKVDVVQMDLLSCMRNNRIFDIVVFNPPYVITDDEEILNDRHLFKAWAGGTNGRKVMERVFPKIPDILSDTGTFYLLVIKENGPEHILRIFKGLGMVGKIVAERKIRGEHLYILRFRKIK
ncbi:hemK methyltransferase 2 [Calliopsis andreniformis]|uniref:hemK methyltransferase 2 n=1 Tax=Calliopsis andreniformis TaxID=337506 RepID=UPI003FCC424A